MRNKQKKTGRNGILGYLIGGMIGGASAGFLTAYLEAFFLLLTVGSFWVDFPFLLQALLIYGLVGSAAGAAGALLLYFVVFRVHPLRNMRPWAFYFAFLSAGGLALEIVIYLLDIHTFRDLLGRWMAAAYGVLLLGLAVAGLAGWLIAGICQRLFQGKGRSLWRKAGIAFLVLIAFFSLARSFRAGQERTGIRPISRSDKAARPNVVILLLDSLRADHLSAYGNPLPTSPTIDRLAREGVLFHNCYAASTWTVPTHASLFTGLYPSTHGGYSLFSVMKPSLPTLSQILAAEGYRTGSFFDNALLGSAYGLSKGFQTALSVDNENKVSLMLRRIWDHVRGHRSASGNILRASAKWINRARREKRPFFLFVNFLDTHLPYRPQKPYIDQFLRSLPAENANKKLVNEFTSNMTVSRKKAAALFPQMTAADWRRLACFYDSNIRVIDDQIGLFLKRLQSLGVMENTLVIITADHGDSMGEEGVGGHSSESVQRSVLRIPLIFWLPGRLPAEMILRPVSQTDIFPTILKLAGLPELIPRQIQGVDLFAPPQPDREILSESWDQDRKRFSRAYFYKNNKLVLLSSGKRELYDLKDDPLEKNDLSQDNPNLLNLLQFRLDQKLQSMPKNDNPASERKKKEMEKLLKSLGYL